MSDELIDAFNNINVISESDIRSDIDTVRAYISEKDDYDKLMEQSHTILSALRDVEISPEQIEHEMIGIYKECYDAYLRIQHLENLMQQKSNYYHQILVMIYQRCTVDQIIESLIK